MRELIKALFGRSRALVWLVACCLAPGLALAVPGTVTGVTATVVSSSRINLSWSATATAVSYQIFRCSGSSSCTPATTVFATSATTSYSNTALTSSTIYRYRLKAVDAQGGVSASYSSIVSGTTSAVAAPTGLTATAFSSSQINLSWTASTGSTSGYQVERCTGATCTPAPPAVASPTVSSYSNTGLAANTSYRYRIRAFDAANNFSAYTTVVGATTPAPDTQMPTAPTGLAATATSSTQISLTWIAATDNVAVIGYRVERCNGVGCTTFAQVGMPTSTSYNDTGLTPSQSYGYRVRATDAAGNLGPYSTTASATTPALGPAIYTYDATGHLKTITVTGSTTITYSYDAAGNLIGIVTTP